MDSITQFVLGASVSALCLGKALGPRKAAIVGGLLGTLPDLDVFIPFDNPVDAFVMHRGWTHSLVIHALAAPILGELLVRFLNPLKDCRALVWLTVFLCLSTHALIDAMTVYGTRLFWPFYPDPVGVGAIFIIDPLYTLPLLGVVIWAMARKHWSLRIGRGLKTALVISTAYMGLGMVLQAHVESRAKVIGLEKNRYHNLYLSLFDGDQDTIIYSHQRRPDLVACLGGNDAFRKLEWFSRGYYRADREREKIVVSDLRMGLTPSYVFRFAIAEHTGNTVHWIPPEIGLPQPRAVDGDLDWLVERFFGRPAIRAAETIIPEPIGQPEINTC